MNVYRKVQTGHVCCNVKKDARGSLYIAAALLEIVIDVCLLFATQCVRK